ncbi:MAG: sugar nucleotide-binding protein [Fimbriimonadaceae bacterium]|uniref:sugar nucleotide-binding protein n=1 Tax=Accumulibacter sp. TaxID=2053492 RepID=UPI001DCF79C7|nr:sugar nucleotide-binding protein [Fimbriimonadaceae bacterium]
MAIVIGANGFLGSRLGARLGSLGEVKLVGRRGGKGIVAGGDLRSAGDRQLLLDLVRGETVFYCAAIGGRQAAEADPEAAFAVNAEIPGLLAAHAARFVYFSTDYVFSRRGRHTDSGTYDPVDTYARSKAAGERAVLAACAKPLIVRVSGLFDEDGTRDGPFARIGMVSAADNRRTRPTYVPDLIETVLAMLFDGVTGIRHVCGPDLLSPYEFWQIVGLRTKVTVEPSVDGFERFDVDVEPSQGVRLRSPSELFAGVRQIPTCEFESVVVSDCVGVVLSARMWRRNDPDFWMLVETDVESALLRYGADAIADAYGPNPAIWHQLGNRPATTRAILANNGPWASFSIWAAKYGFTRMFDNVINSERDGFAKPEVAFREYVCSIARGTGIRLVDDREDIVECAREWGWMGVQTKRVASTVIDQWQLPFGSSMWSD